MTETIILIELIEKEIEKSKKNNDINSAKMYQELLLKLYKIIEKEIN